MSTAPLTSKQRSMLGRMANDIRWSRIPKADRAAVTAPARAAAFQRFLDQVDPDRVLPEAERQALARQARRGELARMSLKGHAVRAAKRAAKKAQT